MQPGIVFALIATVIIMGMLFVFAMPQFAAMFQVGGQAQLQKAVNDIERLAIETYNMAPGSSRLAVVNLAPNTKICFINPEMPDRRPWVVAKKWKWWEPDTVVETILNDPSNEYYGSTLWIYTPDIPVGIGYKIEHIKPAPMHFGDSGNFCIRGGIELYFENKGTYVEISTAEE